MTRSDLIQQISTQFNHLAYKEIELLVKQVFEEILTDALGKGRRIEIRGFGSFVSKFVPPKLARNPKQGSTVLASGRYRVCFKAGKELKEAVNKSFKAVLENKK